MDGDSGDDMMPKKDFDHAAVTWDEKPGRIKLAADVANAIMKSVEVRADMDVLDYGCGTGLLTLSLQPYAHSITGADSSQGMLDVLREKIKKYSLTNVTTQFLDLETGDTLEDRFHLITCSMTFHHVNDPFLLMNQFYNLLHPNGHICIADLDPDEGKFHSNKEGVIHFGFERSSMRKLFIQAGLNNISDSTVAIIDKDVPGEGIRSFSVFLMQGQKVKRGDVYL
jgi:ubiquinone/menaquinone biosynthesis C-methylase UbiE